MLCYNHVKLTQTPKNMGHVAAKRYEIEFTVSNIKFQLFGWINHVNILFVSSVSSQ